MKNKKLIVILIMLLVALLTINYACSVNLDDDKSIVTQDLQNNGTLQASDGGEFYVDPNYEGESDGSKDSPYKDIQTALNNLNSNKSNTIYLKNGVYTGEANTKVSLLGNLIIKADDGANPIINGGASYNYWTLSDSNVLLHGITFTNFKNIGVNYGIITASNGDNLTISGCTFENNTYSRAMHLSKLNNTLIDGCTFQYNNLQSLYGGGANAQNIINLTFSNNLVVNQTSTSANGFFYSSKNENVTIVENRLFNVTGGSGSGIYSSDDKKIKLEKNYFDEFYGNSNVQGRAVYITGFADDVDIINNTVTNIKKNSNSIYINSGSKSGNVNIEDNIISSNSSGGGLYISMYNSGNLTVCDNDFSNNSANFYGAGLYISMSNSGNLTVSENNFINNSVNSYGGALYISMSNSGNLTVSENNFINNSANSYGGAAYISSSNSGKGLIKDNEFINNSIHSTNYGYGGALYLSATMKNNFTIEDNSFINSSVSGTGYSVYGGSIYANLYTSSNQNRSTFSIKNNEFINSSTSSSLTTSNGGSIYISSGTTGPYTNVINNTFTNSSSKNGGSIYASVYDSLIKDNTFTDSNASNQGGAIILTGQNNIISENEFTDGSASTGGAIYISNNHNYVSNNTFTDNRAIDAGAIGINGNNNVISDNSFYNNVAESRGGVIYTNRASNTVVDNNKFVDNHAQIGGAVFFDYYQTYPNIYQNNNNSITNSEFINNEAETAGAVVLYSSNSLVDNCTFYKNTASRYGSGALASGGKNNVISNNSFDSNTAFLYAGAIGANDTKIINNIFKDNTAFQAGAILTINSSIISNTFDGNTANRGSNIAFLDDYNSLLINNINLPESTVYAYDENVILNVVKDLNGKYFLYVNSTVTSGKYYYQAYCIEQYASIPSVKGVKYNGTWGILVDDLYFVRNSLDQSYVGDYIKVLIMLYSETMYNLKDYIFVFTDGDYRNSRDPFILNAIRIAEASTTKLVNGDTWIDGKYYCCEFHTFINPTTRQNLILWNCCRDVETPDFSVLKSASPSSGIKVGDEVIFTVTVTNTKNITLHNLTVKERVPSNFEIVRWINTYGDSWQRTDDVTWLLDRPFEPSEKVSFQIVMKCNSAFSSTSNTIDVSSFESDTKLGSTWIYGESSSSSGLVISKVADSRNGVSDGQTVSFTIQVVNTGSTPASTFQVRDYWESNDYTYLGFSSEDSRWSVGSGSNSDRYFYYNGNLNPGESTSIQVQFKVTPNGRQGYRYNYATLNGQTVKDYYSTYSTQFSVDKNGQTFAPTNSRITNVVTVIASGWNAEGIENVYIEERIPEGLVYDGWSGSSDWIHSITSQGIHRWDYIRPLMGSSSINIYFIAEKPGNYTNVVVSGGKDMPTVTDDHKMEVRGANVNINKITINKTVDVGEQVSFVIALNNNGYDIARDIYVSEYEFDGLVYDHFVGKNWTKSDDGRFYYEGTLAVGQSTYFIVYYNTTKPGTLINKVNVTFNDGEGTNYAQNSTFARQAGMKVEKISLNPVTEVGANVTFAIVVTNTGNYDLTDVVVKEKDFTGLTYLNYENVTGLWQFKQENGTYYFYLDGSIAAGKSAVLNVIFTSDVEGNFSNTVEATSAQVPVIHTTDNSTLFAHPNLEVQKISLDPEVWLGENATFTIIVKNTGDVNLTNVRIQELYPDLIEYLSISEGNWSFDKANKVFKLNQVLTIGQTSSFNITFTTKKPGKALNTIVATSDEMIGNKTTSNDTFIKEAKFIVEKILLDEDVEVGDSISYTIIVNNTGNVDLTNVVINEKYPNELKFISIGEGWSTTDNITFKYNDILKVNKTAELTINFQVIHAGDVTNIAVVNSTETGNETQTAENTTFVKGPNFNVEKLTLNKTVNLGENVIFTIVVTNTGNLDLSNVTVCENYPSGLEFVSFTGNWSTSNNKTFIYKDILSIGESIELNITFKTLEEGDFTNVVDVTSNQTGDLTRPANNTTHVKKHEFTVEKILLNQTVNIDDTIVYTVVVTNTGDLELNNITVNEKYPESLKFISFKGNWTTTDNKVFKYDKSLNAGEKAVLYITFKVLKEGNVTNVVVATTDETGDINKSANDTVFVRKPVFEVEKVAIDKEVLIGDNVVFVITVTNTGNVDLTGITVTEKYNKADLKFVSFKGDWTTTDNKVFTLTNTLEKGASTTLNITFKVVGTDNITNPIDVNCNENKTKITTNDTIFSKNPQIQVDKYTLNRTVYIGNQTMFLIIVSNTGNVDLDNISVVEDYPSELVLDSYIGTNWTRNGKIFNYKGILKPGEKANFTVVFDSTASGDFENKVVAKSNNVSDDSSNVTTVIHSYKAPNFPDNSDEGSSDSGSSDHSINPNNPNNPLLPVKPIPHKYHRERTDKPKYNGKFVPLSRHQTANPIDTLLLIVLLLSVISLFRVKSSLNFNKIGNKKFLFIVLLMVLVLMSAGCVMAADVNQTEDSFVSESYDEIIVLENVAMDDSVIESVESEVVVESASDGGSDDVYQAPSNADSTIYINPNADSSGDGSQEAPYNTIQAALDNIDTSNQNTLVLMDGDYKGESNTNLIVPGNVIISADAGANPTIDFENTATTWNFEGSNVVLTGITFKNAENSNAIISTVGNVNNYIISGCKFTNNINSTLLNLSNVNDVNIIGCEFISNIATSDSKYSIIADNSNNISVKNSKVQFNTFSPSGGFIHANNVTDIEVYNTLLEKIMSSGDGGVLYLNNASGKINISSNLFVTALCEGNGGFIYINSKDANNISIDNNNFLTSASTSKEGQCIYLISNNSNEISINDNSFNGASTTGDGGAISINSVNDKIINIEDNKFIDSRSKGSGASIYLISTASDNLNCTEINLINNKFINDNSQKTSSDASGAVDCNLNRANVIVKNNTFNHSSSSQTLYGAAASFMTIQGSLEFIDNKVIGDSNSRTGDSIKFYISENNRLKVSGNEFINCSSSTGGSLFVNSNKGGELTVSENRFVNSNSNSYGGSLTVQSDRYSKNINIINNEFENSSASYGGTIYVSSYSAYSGNQKDINIVNNSIINSKATTGGSIYNYISTYSGDRNLNLNVEDNTIKNTTASDGGAIYNSFSNYYSNNNNLKYNFINNTIIDAKARNNGGAIYTSARNYDDKFVAKDNKFINSSASNYGGAIYHVSGINTDINNNEFTSSSAKEGGSIYIINNGNKKNNIINNEFNDNSAVNGGAIAIQGNNYNISDNEFTDNVADIYGGAIYSQKTSNDVFDNNKFNNNEATMGGAIFIDYPQNYGLSPSNRYQNENIVISNSQFNSNNAELGGAAVVYSDDTSISNSNFTNNKATRYGGGAVISGGKDSEIVGNTFTNNMGFLYAGAIGTNNSKISNNTFNGNRAYQAGAILTINSTIDTSNKFNGNSANRGSNIVYLDKPVGEPPLSDDSVYIYNSSTILNIDKELNHVYYLYKDLNETTDGYLYWGYCIEENASVPLRNNGTWGILIDDLMFVRNSLDQSYVGKYIIAAFLVSKITDNYNIYKDVFTFTDSDYRNSNDPHIKYIIELADSGQLIIDNNTITYGSTTYKFQTFINPTTRQNLIVINASVKVKPPKISANKTANLTTINQGEKIRYTITVHNDENITLHNLTVKDVLPSANLRIVDWINTKNDTWTRVNETTTWKLNRPLKGFETVEFDIIAECHYLSINTYTLTNKITTKVDELDEISSNVVVNVARPRLHIEKTTTSTSSSYYDGDIVTFKIRVYNDGDAPNRGTITVRDSWSSSDWEFVSLLSEDNKWYQSNSGTSERTFTYAGRLEPGQSSSFYVSFKAQLKSTHGNRYNYAYVFDSGSQQDSSNAYYNIINSPDYNIMKIVNNNDITVGQQMTFTFRISGVRGHIDSFYIEEQYPENWEYVATYGPTFFVHSVSENGVHRWNFVPSSSGPYYLYDTSFTVAFKCNVPGNYTNTIISAADFVETKTSSVNVTVKGTILDIEKITNNQSVKLGEQTSFTIRVHNSGNANWTNFSVKEMPTTNLVYDHYIDTTGNWILDETTLTWKYNGTIIPNETVEFVVFFNTTKHGIATNDVQLNYGPITKYASNTTFIEKYDLDVDKFTFDYTIKPGENTTFGITVRNTGNMNLTNVFVEESNIAGLTFVGYKNITGLWTLIKNGDKYLFKLNGNLAPGKIAEIDVIYRADEVGNFTNIVKAGCNETPVNVTANDTVIVGIPDATVEKLTVNQTVSIGEKVIFTIVVKNTGEIPLHGLTIKENYPDELQFVSATGNWLFNSKNKEFTLDRVLRVNETTSFNVTFIATKEGEFINTVTLSSKDIEEVLASNKTNVINPNFNVEKILLNKTVDVGDIITYSIIINNTGSEELTNVVIDEDYPKLLEYVNVTSGWTTEDNRTFVYSGAIAPGEVVKLEITFKTVARGNATNIVAVRTDVGTKFANNTTIIKGSNFTVEKIALNETVSVGDKVVFTIIVNNTGDYDLENITLNENYPSGLEFVSVSSGWNTLDNKTFKYDGVISVGTCATLNITFKAVSSGNLTNVVTVDGSEMSASGNDSVYIEESSFTVEKIALNQKAHIGDNIVYTIVVTNTGNLNLTNVTLKEFYPSSLEFVSYEGNWITDDNKTFTLSGNITVGNKSTLNITFKILEAGEIKNTVVVDSNDTDEKSTDSVIFVEAPDFTVEKLLLNSTVNMGDTVVYTIVVTNTGNIELTNVTVNENYPDSLKFVSISKGWTTTDNKVFKFNNPLAVGGKAVLNITFKAIETGDVANSVIVNTDQLDGNETTSNSTTVKNPDFTVRKIAIDKIVYVGEDITFIIEVTNTGDVDLTGIEVKENYPESLEFKSYVGKFTTSDNKTFVLTGVLAPEESTTLNITFKVLSKDNITNPIEVTCGNKTKVDNDTIFAKDPHFTVEKIALNKTVKEGENVAFDIIIRNTGNVNLTHIVVNENYPKQLVFLSFTGKDWLGNDEVFIYDGVLSPGESIKLTAIFRATESGEFTNMIDVKADNAVGSASSPIHVDEKEDKTDNANNPDDSSSPNDDSLAPEEDSHSTNQPSQGSNAGNGIQQHATGNPLALLALVFAMLVIPIRRKK